MYALSFDLFHYSLDTILVVSHATDLGADFHISMHEFIRD
jgi:hypothetical protein